MIWPNGPAKRLRNLPAYVDGEHEPFVHFSISKNGYFGVFITKHRIGLYRLKPFAPVFVHTDGEANFSHVSICQSGRYIAVQSGSKIHMFKVAPLDTFNEILRSKSNFGKGVGPGEAVGIREINLVFVQVLESEHRIVNICPFQDYFVVVSPEHMQFSSWSSPDLKPVHTGSILENLKIAQASHSPLLSRVCLLCDTDQLFLVHLKRDQFRATPLPTESEVPLATCFNLRFAKVVVVYESKILLYNVKDMDESPISVRLHSLGQINSLEWSPMGNVLLICHAHGWCCVSVLGVLLYSSDVPVSHGEWSVAGEEIFLLTQEQKLYNYETMRAFFTSHANFETSILCFGNRVQIDTDKSKSALSSNSWPSVPILQSYTCLNWPITTAAASSNGKFIVLAGSYGLIYMSILERQWKVFAEEDIMVRNGGVLWYRNYLILSTLSESSKCKIEMYTTAIKGTSVTDEEEQLLASINFDYNVVTMSVCEKSQTLAVLLHNGFFQVYSIEGASFNLNTEYNLLEVFRAPARVRSMALLSDEKFLFLIDDRLVQVTCQASGYSRRTIHTPVEFFFVKEDGIWLFDGRDVVIVDQMSLKKIGIQLDAYPIGINTTKGVINTAECSERLSFDRSFAHAEPIINSEVYLPHLFEVTEDSLGLAKRYCHLEYFDDIMESTLYHTLVDGSSKLPVIVEITKKYCNWSALAARCARKTETKYWNRLFDAFGELPESLFSQALEENSLDTAAEYLMILQAQFKADPGDQNMIELFKKAACEENFDICKQLSDFLAAIDREGKTLDKFVKDLGIESTRPPMPCE